MPVDHTKLVEDTASNKAKIEHHEKSLDDLFEVKSRVTIPLVETVNTLATTVGILSKQVDGVRVQQIKCKERKLAAREAELDQRAKMTRWGTIATIIGVGIAGIVAWVTLSNGHPVPKIHP